MKPDASLQDRQAKIADLVRELSADSAPILLGPWRSEVGFEALYWLPFLTYLATKVPKFKERAIVVTRGGLALLYAQLAERAMDLYAIRSVKDVRRENLFDHQVTHKGQTQKQLQDTEWDRRVGEDVARDLDLGPVYHTVHPAWMYWALSPYWDEDAGLKYLTSLATYAHLPKPALPDGCPLPPQYVAVKFYGRATFPYPHPDVGDFVQQVVATLAAQVPVVILGVGNDYDDHFEMAIQGPNITTLPSVGPEQNLAVQAAVVAHAQGFVGTYGGFAQLALRLGVPSASVYYQWGGTSHAHLCLSSWLSKAMGVPFVVGDFKDVALWRRLTSVPATVLQAAKQPEVVTA